MLCCNCCNEGNNSLSFNLGDATQALAVTVQVPELPSSVTAGDVAVEETVDGLLAPPPCFTTTVCCTHWHASVILCDATHKALDEMKLSKVDLERGRKAAAKGSAVRIREAKRTVAFLDALNRKVLSGGGRGSAAGEEGNASGMKESEQILAGDFNSVEGTAELQILHQAGFYVADSNVANECTWDPDNPNVAMQTQVSATAESTPSSGCPIEDKM